MKTTIRQLIEEILNENEKLKEMYCDSMDITKEELELELSNMEEK